MKRRFEIFSLSFHMLVAIFSTMAVKNQINPYTGLKRRENARDLNRKQRHNALTAKDRLLSQGLRLQLHKAKAGVELTAISLACLSRSRSSVKTIMAILYVSYYLQFVKIVKAESKLCDVPLAQEFE